MGYQDDIRMSKKTCRFLLIALGSSASLVSAIPPKTAALENARRSQRRAFSFWGFVEGDSETCADVELERHRISALV